MSTADESTSKSASRRARKYCAQCYRPTCDFRGPCRFPHGCCYSVMGIFSAVGGLMMNLYVLGSCMFQRVQQVNHVTGDPIPGSERGYGFLSRETDYGVTPDYHQCTWYPQAEYDAIFDGWMKAGRVFAFASAILATICFAVLFLTCCMAFSQSMFERWLFWMYIVAAITIALSFFIFGSEWCTENDCKVADGCGWAISAFMFHLVAANTVKSFPAPSAPQKRKNRADADHEEEDEDDDLDDLYYETEEDKYPPPNPDGPRGVVVKKNGVKEFDDGEDYYNDQGRLVTDDDKGDYKRTRKADNDDDDDNDDDLDDISDHDLEEYASDEDEDEEKGAKFDEFGNPIYDPDAIARNGNLGVGYENEHVQYDEFGNVIEKFDEYGNRIVPQPQFDEFGNPIHQEQQFDEFGNPIQPEQQLDEFGNPIHPKQQLDEFGNPIQAEQQFDEFGNPIDQKQHFDEFGNPIDQEQQFDEFGNAIVKEQQFDEFANSINHDQQFDEYGNPIQTEQQFDEFGNSIDHDQQFDEYGNPIQTEQQFDEYGSPLQSEQHDQFDEYGNSFAEDNDAPHYDEFGNPLPQHEDGSYGQQQRRQYDDDEEDGLIFT